MKRIRVEVLAFDKVKRQDVEYVLTGMDCEIEDYKEWKVPKKGDILTEYSFQMLADSAFNFINGLWTALNGFFKMTGWAVVLIVSSIKWLWKGGLGKKRSEEEE